MKKRCAFFDVDETLISEKSMFTILEYVSFYLKIDYQSIVESIQNMVKSGKPREDINRYYYSQLTGLDQKTVQSLSNQYFAEKIKSHNESFFIQTTCNMLKDYKREGITPVFVSGSSIDYLMPLAEHLNVDCILATELEVSSNGLYTGEIIGECMISQGKKNAVIDFAKKENVDLLNSFSIGDHFSDVPFLELTGNRYIKAGDSKLEEYAHSNGYKVIE